jgi:hypothetical protein
VQSHDRAAAGEARPDPALGLRRDRRHDDADGGRAAVPPLADEPAFPVRHDLLRQPARGARLRVRRLCDGRADWWIGAIIGLAHTAFLLVVFLPLLARLHPRMANEYDGPSAIRRIEPPGPLGLHYGRPTPLVTLVGQTVFGLILGTFYPMPL